MSRSTKVHDRQFFPKGALIIEQGAMGSKAYVIESGRVEVFVTDETGKALTVAELGPQDIIGEMAVFTESPRSASVRALQDTVVIALSPHDVRQAMRNSDTFYNKLMTMVGKRLQETNTKLLKKEKNREEAEKANQQILKELETHVTERQDRFRQEIAPFLDRIKSALEKLGKE